MPNYGKVVRKTDFDGEKKKRTTKMDEKHFLNLSLPKVHSVRNKSGHLRDFVADNFTDLLCMSDTWLYDDDCYYVCFSS